MCCSLFAYDDWLEESFNLQIDIQFHTIVKNIRVRKMLTSKVFVFIFSGQDLPVKMDSPRITTTAKGDGLIMTYKKSSYRFQCDSSDSCSFEKDGDDLKISRKEHVLLAVPATFVEDC